MNPDVDSDLVVRSLNYHGQQLTNFLKDEPIFRQIDLKGVDYHLYQKRSRELRIEDRGRRLLVHKFIAQNAESLFKRKSGQSFERKREAESKLPPLEAFNLGHLKKEDRIREFYETVQEGDILYGSISIKNVAGLIVTILCLDSKEFRVLDDLGLRAFCPAAEMVPSEESQNYEQSDLICAVVLEVNRSSQRLLIGMKYDSVNVHISEVDRPQLGLVKQSSQMPERYKSSIEVRRNGHLYDSFLQTSTSFMNPNGVEEMCKELGLSFRAGASSLYRGLMFGGYEPESCCDALRRAQNGKMAFNHVAVGVKHFKAGNYIEAFQCLNKALAIDKDNVEALVVRGALHGNNANLEKAILDFESALALNPDHRNAKTYMCETLVALSRDQEDKKEFSAALHTLERALKIDPDHDAAKEGFWMIKKKLMAEEAPGQSPQSSPLEVSDGLASVRKRIRNPSSPSLSPRGSSQKKTRRESGELERKKSTSPVVPAQSTVNPFAPLPTVASASVYGLSGLPHPGYYQYPPLYPGGVQVQPVKTREDLAYEDAVKQFLEKTTTGGDHSRHREFSSRNHDRDHRRRRSRSRHSSEEASRQGRRSRERSKSSKRGSREFDRRKKRSSERESPNRERNGASESKTDVGTKTGRIEIRLEAEKERERVEREKELEEIKRRRSELDRVIENKKKKLLQQKSNEDDSQGFSPNAKRVFRMDDSTDDEPEELNKKPSKDSGGHVKLWKPEAQNQVVVKDVTPAKKPERVSVKDRLGIKVEQGNDDDKYAITLNPLTGMFTRVVKNSTDDGASSKTKKTEKEKKRSKSRDRHSRRSRSRGRSRRSRSRSRHRSRRSRSREKRKRDKSRERTRRSKSKEIPSTSKESEAWKEILAEREKIQREREQLEAEKSALLASNRPILPRPVPTVAGSSGKKHSNDEDEFSGMDSVLNSVLKVVDSGQEEPRKPEYQTASKILPGAKSYEDIQAYLDAAKREKLEKLKNQHRDLQRGETKRW